MSTPRFQLPNPDESPNSLKNQSLILRCLQDPLYVVIKNPTPQQLAVLLRHVQASLPLATVGMIVESLRNETPLDRGALSYVAEKSKAAIEEGTSLVWHEGNPDLTRYVVISSPSEEQQHSEDEESSRTFSGDRFQLTIDRTDSGDVEVSLGWENGDCAESLESLNERWKRVNRVYIELDKEVPPWDLLPHAIERNHKNHDDEYTFDELTLVAYPMDPNVILQDLHDEKKGAGTRERDDSDLDEDGDEPDDPYGLFTGAQAEEAPDVDSEEADGERNAKTTSSGLKNSRTDEDDAEDLVMEGDDLTIIDPSPTQLNRIAQLSSMPMTRDIVERVINLTKENGLITVAGFDNLPAHISSALCIHRRATYILNGSLSETSRYSLDENDLNKPTMFTINLFRQRATSAGQADQVKSVLHWECFSPDCTVANWARIVEIARKRR